MKNKNELLMIGVLTGFGATISYAIAVTIKLHKVAKKMDKAVEDLVESAEIDIPQEMINASIEKNVDREVRYQVELACDEAIKAIRKDISSEIKTTVDAEFKTQKADVAKEIERQIGKIDIDDAKRQVISQAKDEAAKKFKKELDSITDKYTDQLDSMTNIYSTIADKIQSIGD